MPGQYVNPSFTAVPMATLCSKSGCSVADAVAIRRTVEDQRITSDALIVLPDDLRIRSDQEMAYVFEPSVQLVFELNETGSFILRRVGTGALFSTMVQTLSEEFLSVPDDVGDYVWGFLIRLEASGFRLSIVPQ